MLNKQLLEEEDILTPDELVKISSLREQKYLEESNKNKKWFGFWDFFTGNQKLDIDLDIETAIGAKKTHKNIANYRIPRRLGIDRTVAINNISGKNAWLVLTPGPISKVGSISIDKLGQLTFNTFGEYKSQQFSLINNQCSDYDLDSPEFYCTLFLDVDGTWKSPWIDRKMNSRKYDINILERHVLASYETNLIPKI